VTATTGRIGPNAILRVAEALADGPGRDARSRVFAACGLRRYLDDAPARMVDEREVVALHAALRRVLGAALAESVARDAGRRTGDYLLAQRIPRVAQAVVRSLPAAAAVPLLARAVARHAWTFAGSGRFRVEHGRGRTVLAIADNPLCRGQASSRPCCDYYAATFDRLFGRLCGARVVEVACEAAGAPACAFEVTRTRAAPPRTARAFVSARPPS